MLMRLLGAILALGLFTGTALAVPVNLLTNGSFEEDPGTPGLANGSNFGDNWDIWASLPGWNSANAAGIEVQTSGTVGLTPQDGRAYIELDTARNSVIEQYVDVAPGRYMLSFWYSPRVQGDTRTNIITYGIGSTLFGSVTGPAGPFQVGTWTQVVGYFDIDLPGQTLLRFSAEGTSDGFGGYLDNVVVAAVPLPAAGLLLLAALGVLRLLPSRRRQLAGTV